MISGEKVASLQFKLRMKRQQPGYATMAEEGIEEL